MDLFKYLTLSQVTFTVQASGIATNPQTFYGPAPFVSGTLPATADIVNYLGVCTKVLYDSTDATNQPDGLYVATATFNPQESTNDLTWHFAMPMENVFDCLLNRRFINVYLGESLWPDPDVDRFYTLYYPFPWALREADQPVVYYTTGVKNSDNYDSITVKATSGTVNGSLYFNHISPAPLGTGGDGGSGRDPSTIGLDLAPAQYNALIIIDNTGASTSVTFQLPSIGVGTGAQANLNPLKGKTIQIKGVLQSNLVVTVAPNDVTALGTKIDQQYTSQTIANTQLGTDYAEYYCDGTNWWRVG
jgi:hypothetical protein